MPFYVCSGRFSVGGAVESELQREQVNVIISIIIILIYKLVSLSLLGIFSSL